MGLEWESKIWAEIRWKRGEEHFRQRGQHVSVLGGNMLCMSFRNSESKGDGGVARDLRSR